MCQTTTQCDAAQPQHKAWQRKKMHKKAKTNMKDNRIRITQSMEALSVSRDNRSAIAQLREIWPDIELALHARVKHDAIWQELRELGYSITRRNFASAIQRIRKERNAPQGRANTRRPADDPPPTPFAPAQPVPTSARPLVRGATGTGEPQPAHNTPISTNNTELERPPGITNAAWRDMQQKHKAEQRRLNSLNGD